MATVLYPPKKTVREEDDDALYPDSDGKPMAETDLHFDQMVYNVKALKVRLADDPMAYVAGNNFLYWEKGNPKAAISPDCYVVFGVAKGRRRTYMAWRENGILPSVVIEVTSKKTKRKDVTVKLPLYEQTLKIPEYFQFDPTGDYLKPRLQGFQLVDGVYAPIPLVNNRLHSDILGLDLVLEGEQMRFFDPVKQEYLLSHEDEKQRADDEADAKTFLQSVLRAETEAKTALETQLRTEAEEKAALETRLRREAEAKAKLESENERLKAELEALRKQMEQ